MRSLVAVAIVATLAVPVMAEFYVAGDFNGWNASGNVMTDLGNGIYSVDLSNVSGRHEFKVTTGTWTENWPSSGNSWLLGDGSGNVTVTFNANDMQDGWRGNWGRIGTSTDPGTWAAVGDWQGWNNTANTMTPIGGGIYQTSQTLAPGWYQWKSVVTGTWDSIGDDWRGINATTTWFEVTEANPTAVFEVNALAGVQRVYTTPEPTSILLLVAGAFGLRRRSR